MSETILAIIASAFTLAIGLFKYFASKDKEMKEKIAKAEKAIEDGINGKDPSSITRGFDRIRRM